MELPKKRILLKKADKLWSAAVKDDWNHKCIHCGKRNSLNAHHLIPRQHYSTRFDVHNGICLCSHCHNFNADMSPHQNPAGFMVWLRDAYPGLYRSYTELAESKDYKKFSEIVNQRYYCKQILLLREFAPLEDYERICGPGLARWLEKADL